MTDMTGKEALERIARMSIGEGRHPVEYSTIRAIATDFAALEARAIAAEERVKRLESVLRERARQDIKDIVEWLEANTENPDLMLRSMSQADFEVLSAALAGGKP